MGTTSENTPPVHVCTWQGEGDIDAIPGMTVKADGTVIRNTVRLPPCPNLVDPPSPGVASKDVTVDPRTGVWGRIFLPERALGDLKMKLPLVANFHGGGFCMGDAGAENPVNEAIRLCKTANVVVFNASYRLAPENRLPTAYEDACTTMSWLGKQCTYQANGEEAGEPWLMDNADFSRVFVTGQSAGGNIAHHVFLIKTMKEPGPLLIKGVIFVVPYFSGESQSESEKKFPNDEVLPLERNYTFWRLALPVGATRDHAFCNPLSPYAPDLAEVQFPRILLIVGGKDPLYTRQIEYFNALKKAGKEVDLVEVPEGTHTFRKDPAFEAENLRVNKAISDFIHKSA